MVGHVRNIDKRLDEDEVFFSMFDGLKSIRLVFDGPSCFCNCFRDSFYFGCGCFTREEISALND